MKRMRSASVTVENSDRVFDAQAERELLGKSLDSIPKARDGAAHNVFVRCNRACSGCATHARFFPVFRRFKADSFDIGHHNFSSFFQLVSLQAAATAARPLSDAPAERSFSSTSWPSVRAD